MRYLPSSFSSFSFIIRMAGGHTAHFLPIPKGLSIDQHRENARKYYRAICHMYLLDFLCFSYELPTECADIYEAAMQQVEKWRAGSTMIEDELTETMDRQSDTIPYRSEKDILTFISLAIFILILMYYLFPSDSPLIQKLLDLVYTFS